MGRRHQGSLPDALAARDEIAVAWRRLRAAAVDADLLSEDAAGALPPQVAVTVHDRRKNKTELPELPPGATRLRIGDIHWHDSYDDAVEVARREGKPLLLHFGENPG